MSDEAKVAINAAYASASVFMIHRLINEVVVGIQSPEPKLIISPYQDAFVRTQMMSIPGNWRGDSELDPYARADVIIDGHLPKDQIRVECNGVFGFVYNLSVLVGEL